MVVGAEAAGGPDRVRTNPPGIVRLHDVIRIYREADVETVALRGVDLEVAEGEYVVLMGRSGSGKSTLLHLIAGMDRPTAGRVEVAGIELSRAAESIRAAIRGATVGIMFQDQNLPAFLDLEEGVLLAMSLAGRPADRAAAFDALHAAGLGERRHHRPQQLSGGEQQRAALATIVATHPKILLADEMTGELDSATATALLDFLDDVHAATGMTIVAATHDPDVARRADRVIHLRDGQVAEDDG